MTLLLETTNSFGRQHHLNIQRSEPRPYASPDSCSGKKHAFSAPLLGEIPQLDTDDASATAHCGGMSAFWFDAQACTRCAQHSASPAGSSRSASDMWHDAISDSASSACSSSVPDCSEILQEDRKRSLRDNVGSACSLDIPSCSVLEHQRREEDARQRLALEQEAAQQELRAPLEAMKAAQREQLEGLLQQADQARQCAHQAQQQAEDATAAAADAGSQAAAAAVREAEATSEAQVAAARLVSGALGRVVGRSEAQQELALLRKRVEQLCSMDGAMGVQARLHGADAQDSLQRQLVNVGMAVGCAAVGLAGAYLLTRRHR